MNGLYLLKGKIIGKVENFNPKDWYGKVTLNAMPEMAEYGTLDPDAEVLGDDTKTYKRIQ